jgi:hypothetical protein
MFEVLELPDGITALYQKQGKNLEVLFFKKNGFPGALQSAHQR